jgi:hypothetical protein
MGEWKVLTHILVRLVSLTLVVWALLCQPVPEPRERQ